MAKIVFLEEYCIRDTDLSSVKSLGEYTGYFDTTPEQTVERCKDTEIVITNKVVFDDKVMSQLPRLKLICVSATGMNNIDLEAAEKRGIAVRNAKGYSTHSVAETTLMDALGLLREVVYYDRYVKEGGYTRSEHVFSIDRNIYQLHGKNWGIIGLGTIGREVARLAEAFGCEVAYHSTSGITRKEKYQEKTLNELLEWSDIVSIHAPLNEKTENLIGDAELKAMKPTAIIINVARGGIVNESALAGALNSGEIAGAAIDVYTAEPVKANNPLFTVKDKYKLLLSPHNAWAAEKALDHLIECVAENIRNFLAGQ